VAKTSALLTIGSEVIDGRVLNSNAQYLGKLLKKVGVPVKFSLSCDDKMDEILDSLEYLEKRTSLIIITGGIGPTSDDITRQAVAAFCGQELVENETALSNLINWYTARGRSCEGIVRQQALIPEHSSVIQNSVGSASGFFVQKNENLICSLPGVPRELYAMMDKSVIPELHARGIAGPPINEFFWRLFGLPESEVQQRLVTLEIPSDIQLSFRAAFPEVHLQLTSRSLIPTSLIEEIARRVGQEYVICTDTNISLVDVVHLALKKRRAIVAVAESCTGGSLSSLITAPSGASKIFYGGVVAYDNSWKTGIVEVNPEILDQYGAVSAECAIALARGIRERTISLLTQDKIKGYHTEEVIYSGNSSSSEIMNPKEVWGLSITGIAGPSGGTPPKPVGTFFAALSGPNEEFVVSRFVPADRDRTRTFAAHTALDALRRALLELSRSV